MKRKRSRGSDAASIRRRWFFQRRPSVAPFERFGDDARRVLSFAQEEARNFNHNYIGTEHLLLGLVREEESLAGRVLASMGVQLSKVRSAVTFIVGRGQGEVMGDPGLTPRAKKVIELAMDEARRLSSHYIGPEHLLLGLVREGEGIAAGVLESLSVSQDKVRRQVMTAIARPGEPLPPLMLQQRGITATPTDVLARVRANELVYGLALPPELFAKLGAVAQRLSRPVDDLIREAIERTWLDESPPADSAAPPAETPST